MSSDLDIMLGWRRGPWLAFKVDAVWMMDDAKWLILGRWELLGTARVSPTDAPRLLLLVSLRCAALTAIHTSKQSAEDQRFQGNNKLFNEVWRRWP